MRTPFEEFTYSIAINISSVDGLAKIFEKGKNYKSLRGHKLLL